jgi:hypothetical protein
VGGVADEHAVLGAALVEGLDRAPAAPVAGLGVADLEQLVLRRREHRRAQDLEGLPGRAVALADDLVVDVLGVLADEDRADRLAGDREDLRRALVGRPARLLERRDAAAQPVQAVSVERYALAVEGQLEHHLAAAEVEAAGRVVEHGDRLPDEAAVGRLAGRHLPAKRRAARVDAGAARGLGLDGQAHQQLRQRVVEAQVHRVAGDRHGGERRAVGADRARDARVDGDVAPLAVAVHDVGRRGQRRDRAALGDLEDDGLLVGRAHGADLGLAGGDRQRLLGRGGEREAHLRARGRRRAHRHAEQLEQVDVDLVGDAVEAVRRHLRHPREQLDQRDPGV